MKEILLLNPSRRRKTKRRATKKRKTTRKRATKKRTTVRRNATRNPARTTAATKGTMMAKKRRKKSATRRIRRRNPTSRRLARRAGSRAGGAFAGLNFKSALKNIPMNTFGMFAAKWAAKRFGQPATETDPSSWNYASYLKGAAGAAAAGFIANMLRRGTGQRVLEGGMSLMLYKLIQNELIPNSPFWTGQLGADAEGGYSPGDVETDAEGEPYILGDDLQWYPLTGASDTGMYGAGGGALVTPGPLGDALLTPGPLGATSDIDNMMLRSFLTR
jgi:hypothetical protein